MNVQEERIMLNDHFMEEVVVRRKKGLTEALYYLSWVILAFSVLCAIIGFNSVTLGLSTGNGIDIVSVIFTLVTAGIAVYTWLFHDKLRLEYEYTFTNGALDFAEVYNNKKRKSLGSLNVRNIESFGKVSGNAFSRYLNMNDIKRMNWFLNRDAELYYFYFSKENSRKMIIFEPSEEMVENIKFYLPHGTYQE